MRTVSFWIFIVLLLAIAPLQAATGGAPRVLRQESTTLPTPASTGAVAFTLRAGGRDLALDLIDNPALGGRIPAGVRVLASRAEGADGSWARLSHYAGGWHGVVFDGATLWLVEPADATDSITRDAPAPSLGNVTLYRADDLVLPDFVFDRGGVKPTTGAAPATASTLLDHLPSSAAAGVAARLPVTLVADVAFRGIHGGNTEAVLLTVFNVVDGIYSDQVGIGLSLEHVELLTSDGPLLSPDMGDLLREFSSFMFNGAGSAIPQSGNGHLFTGRNFDNAGIAWLGALCSADFGHGVNRWIASAAVTSLIFAHELGHNFGAPHDAEDGSACQAAAPGLMAPTVGSTNQFSQCSIDQMQREISTAFCLLAEPGIASADFNGNWFNPSRDGEGVQVSVEGDGATFILSFYTYLEGRQTWMIGAARTPPEGETQSLVFDLTLTTGADFGSRFRASDVIRRPWGQLELTVDAVDCNQAQLSVTPALAEFGPAFVVPVTRIVPRPGCG
jgi:hypothetical protein